MAKTFFLTTIAIVVSSSVNSERRPFLSYSKNLQQAVPHFWKHDQEKLDRNLDKNPGQRWESVRAGPRPPPLRPDSPAPWHFRNHLADKQSTLNRVHQLKNKLIPKNIIHVQALNHPHPKPAVDLKKSLENNKRHKRGLAQADHESRDKREVIINPQIQPEMVMQPHIQPALLQEAENKYQDKIIEKRDKRQILLMIKRQPLKMVKKPRTTPNPFIRDTNIADYDIVKPDTYKPEVEIVNSMDSDSYQLSETSELDYESDYTISMSDSEDWENYPLTTPSGPNPGWGLPTLADMYQRPKGNGEPFARVKRSPKQRKRKIGEYKRKLKEKRKKKEAKRKRRIIRNSKEDKAVKEEIKEEDIIEKFLQKPKMRPRQNFYQEDKTSKEILWTNGTHRIIEDPDATFRWVNGTHYVVEKENATEEWYRQNHVLVCNEEYWANRTREIETNKNTKQAVEEDVHDEDYSGDYDEEFTREEEEERAIKTKKSKKGKKTEKVENVSQKKKLEEKMLENVEKDTDGDSKQKSETIKEKEKKITKKKVDKKTKKGKVKKTVKNSEETENSKEIPKKKVKIKNSEETENSKEIPKKKVKAKDSVEVDSDEKNKENKRDDKITDKGDKIKKTKRTDKTQKLAKSKVDKETERIEDSSSDESVKKKKSNKMSKIDSSEDESLSESKDTKKKATKDKPVKKIIKKKENKKRIQKKTQSKKQNSKKGKGKKSKT